MSRSEERDWSQYNEQLVQRGQILLKVDALRDWQAHLARMNEGKRGRPYDYPDVMILLFGMMRMAFQLPYRQLEGFARGLGRILDLPAPDYTTLNIRLNRAPLDPQPEVDPNEPVTLAVDSSGVELVREGSEFFRPTQRKDWVKIHVAIDVESKQVISIKPGPGQLHDTRYLYDLLRDAETRVRIDKVLADSGYDSGWNFNLLRIRGITPGIKPRGSSGFLWHRKPPRTARAAVVKRYIRDPEGWKQEVGYNQRQLVESFFSAFKQLFGHRVMSHNWLNVINELYVKAWLYNLWVSLSPDAGAA